MRSYNPSFQCSVCGQWKRLNGIDKKTGNAVQRFYPCCEDEKGNFINHDRDVCDECCKRACPYRNKKQK